MTTNIYSLGSAWNIQQAGVEHAMKARHELLTAGGFNHSILLTTNQIEVSDDNIMSMIEYFQGEPAANYKDLMTIDLSQYDAIKKDENVTEFFIKDRKIISHTQEQYSEALTIHYGPQEVTHYYTYRGYHYSISNDLVTYYNKQGQIALSHVLSSNIYILHDKNKTYRLTFVEIVAEFINSVTKSGDIVIFDRTDTLETLPKYIKNSVRKILPIHNNHIASNDISDRRMNSFYTYMLSNSHMFDLVVTATHQQAEDIQQRFGCRTAPIPVGYVKDSVIEQSKQIPEAERFSKAAVMFSRIALDKQIHLVADAYAKVIEKHPDALLVIYGFANEEADGSQPGFDALVQVIEHHGISENVLIAGYVDDKAQITNIEQHASLYLLGSQAEGFNLGLMEGLGAGLIGVSTDVKYGPSELICHNDCLLEYNDFDAMAEQIIKLYDNLDELPEMRQESLEHIKHHYSETVVKDLWTANINYLINGGH